MLRVTQATVAQQRTIRPIYADHQATPYGALLDTGWDRSYDIYPGMVMSKTVGENTILYAGSQTGNSLKSIGSQTVAYASAVPWGLSALFVAPGLGIDEVALSGTNLMTVWRGGSQATFQILAPAFDQSVTWPTTSTGARNLIAATTNTYTPTFGGVAIGPGKVTLFTMANYNSGYISEPIGQLISYDGPSQITINFAPQISYFGATALENSGSPVITPV